MCCFTTTGDVSQLWSSDATTSAELYSWGEVLNGEYDDYEDENVCSRVSLLNALFRFWSLYLSGY